MRQATHDLIAHRDREAGRERGVQVRRHAAVRRLELAHRHRQERQAELQSSTGARGRGGRRRRHGRRILSARHAGRRDQRQTHQIQAAFIALRIGFLLLEVERGSQPEAVHLVVVLDAGMGAADAPVPAPSRRRPA